MAPPSRILKAVAPLPARCVPAVVHAADQRVREMLDAAGREASRIRAEAEGARERDRAEAVEEGRREGLSRAAATVVAAAAERDRILSGAGREVVSIALAVARKVLGRELAEREGAIADLAAVALAAARDRREVVLTVNPGDAPVVRDAEHRLGALLPRARLEVREDPAVSRGAAVVDTEAGRLDAGIEVQIERLAHALEEAFSP